MRFCHDRLQGSRAYLEQVSHGRVEQRSGCSQIGIVGFSMGTWHLPKLDGPASPAIKNKVTENLPRPNLEGLITRK